MWYPLTSGLVWICCCARQHAGIHSIVVLQLKPARLSSCWTPDAGVARMLLAGIALWRNALHRRPCAGVVRVFQTGMMLKREASGPSSSRGTCPAPARVLLCRVPRLIRLCCITRLRNPGLTARLWGRSSSTPCDAVARVICSGSSTVQRWQPRWPLSSCALVPCSLGTMLRAHDLDWPLSRCWIQSHGSRRYRPRALVSHARLPKRPRPLTGLSAVRLRGCRHQQLWAGRAHSGAGTKADGRRFFRRTRGSFPCQERCNRAAMLPI